MTHATIADGREAVREAANKAGFRLLDYFEGESLRAYAILVSAIGHEGWRGDDARDIFNNAAGGGVTSGEYDLALSMASKVTDPWSQWSHEPGDVSKEAEQEAEADKAAARDFAALLREHAPKAVGVPTSSGIVSRPNRRRGTTWLMRDFVACKRLHLLSAPTGSFKSGLLAAMIVAGIKGEKLLGRDVGARKFLLIDAENTQEDLLDRLDALGLSEEERGSGLRFWHREDAVRLGTADSTAWLESEISDFQPDLVLIDGVAQTFDLDVMDRSAVGSLYAEILLPLVDRYGVSVLFTSAERKSGGGGNRQEAAIGVVEFIRLTEQHLTIASTSKLDMERQEDGSVKTRRTFAVRFPKGRSLVEDKADHFDVTGRFVAEGDDDILTELVVSLPQPVTGELPLPRSIVGALNSPLGSGALAKSLGLHRTGNSFRTGLNEAIDAGLIRKNDDGLYERVLD